MSGLATRANGSLDPEYAALAALAFASSTPSDTRVAAEAGASFFGAAGADALDLDLSDPAQARFGDYTLKAKLGQGGMGVVYQAHQHSLDRDVAVKLLAAGPWASKGFVERFRLEAQSAARMQHRNIVTIHEIGEQDGLPFFSMRLVRGRSLAERLAQGPMPAREAAALLRTVAEAVDYAHRLGVLHLDLKPGNVLIDEDGEPLVADFGLARRLEESLSGSEEISGTPSYMAPEQATAGQVGIATDVYALGATLFEALNGRPPFRGATARETLEQVVFAALPAPREFAPGVPADLRAICLRCLRKNPAERYPSARALAEDLADFLRGREVKARPLNRPQKLVRMVRREPRLAALVMLFTGSLLLGLFATTVQWNRAEAGADSARQSLWRERAQAAETALEEGDGFRSLNTLVENLAEMEAVGARRAVEVERQRIGTLLANAPQLLDRIPLEEGQVASSVALSPDGSRVAVATYGSGGPRRVRQYDLASGAELWAVETTGQTHSLSMANHSPHGPLRYSADGARIVVGLMQQPVFAAPGSTDEIAIDAASGRLLQPSRLPEGFSDFSFDPDARRAILRWRTDPSLRFADRFRFLEVDGWRAVGPEHVDTSSMWLFAPGGEWLLRTRDFQHFEAVEFGSLAPRWSLSFGDEQLIRAWRFAPDGRTLALGALDGAVLLVDSASGRIETLPASPADTVRWLEFDRAGNTLAALSQGGSLMAWDLATRRPRMLPLHAQEVDILSRVHLDQDLLAVPQADGIGMWLLPPLAPYGNEALAQPARVIGRRSYGANAFLIDPARRLLLSGGADGAIGIWRLPAPALLRWRAAPMAAATQAFDGRRVPVIDGRDLRLVELADGREAWPAWRHPQPIQVAELSHDGRWLVSIASRTLRIFDAASGQLHAEPIVLPATPLRVELARAAPLLLLSVGSHEAAGFVERVLVVDLERATVRAGDIELPQYTHLLAFDPRGRYLAVAGLTQPKVQLIGLGQALPCGEIELETTDPIGAVALAADGERAWIQYSPGRRQSALALADLRDCSARSLDRSLHIGPGVGLVASGDGVVAHRYIANTLALVGPEGARGRLPALGATQTSLPLLAVSADGARAAVATRNSVQVYDLVHHERLSAHLRAALPGDDEIVRLAFAPDGASLLARSLQGGWLHWALPAEGREGAVLQRLTAVLDPASRPAGLSAQEAAQLRDSLRRAARPPAPPPAHAPVRELSEVEAAAPDPRFQPLDLHPALNVLIGNPWPRMATQGGAQPTLARGAHRLAGIDWRFDGGVQLSGGGPAVSLHPEHPQSAWVPVADVPARRVHLLMLLHIPMRPGAPPRRAAQVLLQLADGSQQALDVVSVRDVVTHWQPDLAAPSARVAWAAGDSAYGLWSWLYAVSLDLPAGSAPVRALALRIGDGPMEAPLFYAVTLELEPTSLTAH